MQRKAKPDEYVQPMPKGQLFKIIKSFRRIGGTIQMNEETDAHLKMMDAEGSTLNGDIILLRRNPGRAAVYEELIHAFQYRRGENSGTTESKLICEIKAQRMLIKNAKAYKLTDKEVEQTRRALKFYEEQLNDERRK